MTDATTTPSSAEGSQPAPAARARSRADRIVAGFLAAMVSTYSILTAVTLFSASRAEGLYYDNVFIAQAHLSDASELAIEANIGILHDLSVFEQMQVHELSGSDPAIIEFLYGQLSGEAQASLERSGGADEAYGEEAFSAHVEERELAMMSFEHAMRWSQRAGVYEALGTILAVGLAFAAWASLMERTGWVRGLFTLVAFVVLIASLCFLGIHLMTREPLPASVALVSYEGYAGAPAT